jgi:hypothetical protein
MALGQTRYSNSLIVFGPFPLIVSDPISSVRPHFLRAGQHRRQPGRPIFPRPAGGRHRRRRHPHHGQPHRRARTARPPARPQEKITLEQLAKEPWLMRERGSGTTPPASGTGQQRGDQAGHPRRTRHFRLSRHALALNQPGQFAVLNVVGFPILRHWYAVYPAGRQLSVVARAFLDYLLGRGIPRLLRRAKKASGVHSGCRTTGDIGLTLCTNAGAKPLLASLRSNCCDLCDQ